MKLYYAKGACSLAVHILLQELDVPYALEAVNLSTKKTASGHDFLTVNPKGAVPALELDDGTVLTENTVIQQYLVDRYQARQLLPEPNNLLRYQTLTWLNYISTELHKGCSPFFNPQMPAQVLNDIFKPLLYKKLDYINQHLQDKSYLMGNQFTLPDGYLFVILTWLPHFNISLADWPALSRFFSTVHTRASIQQALKQESLAALS